jgi:pyridoxal phosphate enzyme (YggS family)
VAELSPERVRGNVAVVRERIVAAAARAGRRGEDVALLAAVKYVPGAELGVLAAAGIELIGENRAQDLVAKVELAPGFRWHFIGQLQSRKVKLVAPRVELIHSLASMSAARALGACERRPGLAALIEVNVAGEAGKAGVAPGEVGALIEACPVAVVGLMTMPPAGGDSRRWFSDLRELAGVHGLRELSMGTSQDYELAVEEGATIVRIGTILYT